MNFAYFLFFVLFGAGMYGLSYLFRGAVYRIWDRVWLRAGGGGARKGLLRRVKFAVQLARFPRLGYVLYFLAILMGFMVLAVTLGMGKATIPNFIGLSTGYVVIPAIFPTLYSFRGIPERHLRIAILAMKRLVALAPRERQQDVLAWATTFSENWIRIAAINGYMEVTQPWSLKEVERMEKDPDSDVRQAAKEASALLYALLYGSGARSLMGLERRIEQFDLLLSRSRQNPTNNMLREEVQRAMDAIDDVVYSQVPLREAYPHLYCKQCKARTEWMKHGEWEWVRCKRCHDVSQMQKGVVQVRGEIGGKVDWELNTGLLTLRAWDETQKAAGPLEVDMLHVYAGAAIDYDWAVSAVVQKLQNHVHAGERVPVTIDPGVALSANTQMLLRSLDPEVRF